MRHVKHKWFFAWEFEKEEQWLNRMSAEGLQLVSVGFCKYVFEDGAPGEYLYRLELLKGLPDSGESRRYIAFLEETGAEYIDHMLRWAFFRKKAEKGPFDLFSDIDSKIAHFSRLRTLMGVVCLCTVPAGINNIWLYFGAGAPKVNLVLGLINIVLDILLAYGTAKVWRRINGLKRERAVRE